METESGYKKFNLLKCIKDLRTDKKKTANQNQNFREEGIDSMGTLLLILIITFICYCIYLAYH